MNHGFHGCARIETNRDTSLIRIGQMEDNGDFAADKLQKTGFLLIDDREFAMNSVDSSFSLSVIQSLQSFVSCAKILKKKKKIRNH